MKSCLLSPVLGLVILASTGVWWSVPTQGQEPQTVSPTPPQATTRFTVDVAAFDNAGRIPESLAPADVAVTIGGRVRTVLWIRRVSRGPGALADAAARRERGNPALGFVAEPNRTVLLVID